VRDFAEWLYGTAPSVAIHSTVWVIRLVQATHLLTAGVVAGSGVMIALRALGLQRADQPFEAVWKRFAPWLLGGLAVMVVTGLAQTLGDPVREFTATSYWLKLALLAGCIAGTLYIACASRRASNSARSSSGAKLVAAWLILSWLAIVMLGRMIGYDLAIWGSWSLRT
jgi:putative copper export protein